MKLTILFSFLFAMQLSASVTMHGQVSLHMQNESLRDVFKEIEKQSPYRFFYNESFADLNKRIHISIENNDINATMNELLSMSDISYQVLNNNLVVIGPKKELQQLEVTGRITDASTGESLPGVSVLVEGTTIGTISDPDGNYTLSVPDPDGVLVFSFIGYTARQVPVEGREVVNVALDPSLIDIDEVVVVGYGTQRRVNLTGSVTNVNLGNIESRPLTNASQALQGASGVYVNQAGGQPGKDNATIRIRGVGTLNDSNPLIIVDGVESSLRDVNPSDIESISVLKDAASASIYGNRAANGVILITTKKGVVGELIVELNSYTGVQQATYLPDVVSNSVDFMKAMNQAYINEGQNPIYSVEDIEEYRQGSISDPSLYPNNDWYDIMYSEPLVHEHHLRISGGDELVTYSTSLGYMDQEGVLMGTDAKKYSLNSNVHFNATERLTIGANISGSYWDRSEQGYPGDAEGSVINFIAKAIPMNPTYLPDGRYGDSWLRPPGHGLHQHPIVRAIEGENSYKTQRALINLSGEYRFPI